ncbi:GT-D fold domain-containing glycosyltransferase [Mesobacillus subterraneus]|uniref:GT-D fold domain-containing protein n=1 Tax=Mesobacillus subterraneus TaxID=285983 RepID=UPI001CFD106F|nr:GT-D fold domain-containing glycosyltransferase [Mesobacillus subterraneus]WLR54788.1 GT-D fold domain-containing glycosyltransferase [Mesobacillus subterraneus]
MSYSISREQWETIYNLGYPGQWDKASLASEAIYKGGEDLIQRKLKDNQYLPYNIEDIIEEGLKSFSKDIIQLKTPHEVKKQIWQATSEKKGLSVIRLGDGELLALAHDILVPSEVINKSGKLKYALGGFKVPDIDKRKELTRNLSEADIIGIPAARYPTYQRLFNKLAKSLKLPLNEMNITDSRINYLMNDGFTIYHDLLSKYRILLIGNRAKDGSKYFKNLGYKSIVGTISVPNIYEVPKVLEEVNQYEFDVAFVSAGIPANLICVDIAKKGKVAIDFGHLLDWYIEGRKMIKQN